MASYTDIDTRWTTLKPVVLGQDPYGYGKPNRSLPVGTTLTSLGFSAGWGSDPGLNFKFRLEDGFEGILRDADAFYIPKGVLAPAENTPMPA